MSHGPSFFQTIMGRKFYEVDVPSGLVLVRDLIAALRANTEAANRLAAALEATARPEKKDKP